MITISKQFLKVKQHLRLRYASNSKSDQTAQQQQPSKAGRHRTQQTVEEQQHSAQCQCRLAAISVAQLTPERGAEHHAQEHDGGRERLLVPRDVPITVQGRSEYAQNCDLHWVGHPAETNAQRQLHLEPPEAQCIDCLRHGVCVWKRSIIIRQVGT